MKSYTLNSTKERSSIGSVETSNDFKTIKIKLSESFCDKYSDMLREVIPNIIKQGKFKTNFDVETLVVTEADNSFWQALIQALIAFTPIIPESAKG